MAIGLVFGAGSLAGLVGPGLAEAVERLAPGFYIGTALLAAAAQFVALAFAAATSRRLPLALQRLPAARRTGSLCSPRR